MMNTNFLPESNDELSIAIVGMSCRFPGAKNIAEFWQNLVNGVESVTYFTDDELKSEGVNPALLSNPNYIKTRATLADLEQFDASFFGFTPREAEMMDPQHRLFLECAWEAMENAAYDSQFYHGQIGVFAGVGMNTYLLRNLLSNPNLIKSLNDLQISIGNDKDFVPTQVSYKLNLTGPSINVNTACSSSLVAVQMACQNLLNYQCDLALAGGVSIIVPQKEGYLYQEGGILSPDGHCRAFDAKAKGCIDGSGVGIVVLKRLEDALTEGDNILAVIKSSAINNDGSCKVGFTAPSIEGQAAVISEALEIANIDTETVTYVETHGTGTVLGDPIEISALTQAFRISTQSKGFCRIGSVKTNIGHLGSAAGVAGLIKTVLALQHKQIPASLNFEQPNPKIDFANSPFYVNRELSAWETTGSKRRAGVSSFGIGGTNVHMILEEAPTVETNDKSSSQQVLMLSAKTSSALKVATTNLLEYLKQHRESNLADIAFTLQVGRRDFSHRRAVIAKDISDAISALQDPQRMMTGIEQENSPPVAFIFTGIETQYFNLAEELYQFEPIFQESIDLCSEILKSLLGITLQDLLTKTSYAQLAIYVVEYALAKLWQSWSIAPEAMIGYSIGEYVAATIAGVFSLEDALTLIAKTTLLADEEKLYLKSLDITESVTKILNTVNLQAPKIPFISNLTGTWITTVEALDVNYWSKSLFQTLTCPHRQTGSFVDGVKELWHKYQPILLEIGAEPTLSALVLQNLDSKKEADKIVLSSSLNSSLLNSLSKLWLSGIKIDWSNLYADQQRNRLPLPTYPFERQRFWIEPKKATDTNNIQVNLVNQKSDITNWFYMPSWKRSHALTSKLSNILTQSCWLVFLDEYGLGEQLVKRLEAEGQEVIIVQVGTKFERCSERLFTINPQNNQDYNVLIAEVLKTDNLLTNIIHLWSVNDSKKIFEEIQNLGFYSLLFLTQALAKSDYFNKLDITVISNNIMEVTGDEELCPEKATILGAIKTIPQEYLNITCRNIDLILPKSWQIAESEICDRLLREITEKSEELVVAFRNNYRWLQTFEPAKLNQPDRTKLRLREGGVYLITGGLGRLGLILAKELVQNFRAKVVLLGRSIIPERNQWETWLAKSDHNDSISLKLRKLQELEQISSEYLIIHADVTNQTQMQAAVAKAEEKFGQINGVIHAAGILTGNSISTIAKINKTECEEQFKAKVQGSLILQSILQDKKLDFCLFTSSLASILGGLGLTAYAAANLFIDTLIRQQNQKLSIPWISVNLGDLQYDSEPKNESEYGIKPEQIKEIFQHIWYQDSINQMIVSPGNLQAHLDKWIKFRSLPKKTISSQPNLSSIHQRANLATVYVAPRNKIEQTLANIWQELLGIQKVGIHDDFFELEGDSLLGTQLISRIREAFELDLPLSSLFEQSTIVDMAKFIETSLSATVKLETAPPGALNNRIQIEL